jgi:hypothetical protein
MRGLMEERGPLPIIRRQRPGRAAWLRGAQRRARAERKFTAARKPMWVTHWSTRYAGPQP